MPDTMSYISYRSTPKPSELEVDYDVNITSLYEAICNCDWDEAILALDNNPEEARTWVVRHYEEEDDMEGREVMWRFLPLHSACARDPPAAFISALIKAYPDGPHCVDDQGMYPLHYACGNQASREVIRLLLVANSMAARCQDPRGMLPIHYLACWGPSSVSIIDMVLVANRDVSKAKDNDGNTPLDLAMEGDYPEHDAVVAVLKRWLDKSTPRSRSIPRAIAASEPRELVNEPPNFPRELSAHHASNNASERSIIEPSPTDEVQDEISHKLTVNTTMDEEVEVHVSSPLSEKDTNLKDDIENPAQDFAEEKEHAAEAAVSPRSLARLRHELTTLRNQQQKTDEQWQNKFETQVGQLTDKCQGLESQIERLTASLATATQRVTELELDSSVRDEHMKMTESQLSDALEKVDHLGEENEHLRQSLKEVTEERDQHALKVGDMNERLGNLAASLASIMDRQELLIQNDNEKNAQLTEASLARREHLSKLFEMEQQFMETVMSPHDGGVSHYDEQMQELDAMSADIEAMRV